MQYACIHWTFIKQIWKHSHEYSLIWLFTQKKTHKRCNKITAHKLATVPARFSSVQTEMASVPVPVPVPLSWRCLHQTALSSQPGSSQVAPTWPSSRIASSQFEDSTDVSVSHPLSSYTSRNTRLCHRLSSPLVSTRLSPDLISRLSFCSSQTASPTLRLSPTDRPSVADAAVDASSFFSFLFFFWSFSLWYCIVLC